MYSLLVGSVVHGWHVLHQRSSSTTVKEVDRTTNTASSVCGSKATIEVWGEVDRSAVVRALCENTWDRNADIWLGVYDSLGKALKL